MAGGTLFEGANPIAPSNTLSLLIIQILVVITTTRLLSIPLQRLHQPRVIAEVLGGIVLGPSVLGNWDAWRTNVFPPASLPYLKQFADIGLIFFMFLIGLELDLTTFKANIKKSLTIAGSGLLGPFAVSAPVAYLLYSKYGTPDVSVGNFILFIMVSMSITAFPVLARLLADHNLFHTPVGITAISAASIDDAVGWCLLALVVAIVSANSALSALWAFLCGVAWVLFMLFFVRKVLVRLVKLSATHETLSTNLIFFVYFMVLVSSWVTEAIGIHAIFGAFILGLVVPHEDGFAIQLTEKTEDFIAILLVPLYFANSGLRTKIGLLNDGEAWGMVILIITCACTGKIFGATFASRLLGLSWRESWTVGFLMNTKGLVELIVLNVGLDAKVISEKVFVMMTIMALVTTLMTSPVLTYLYPAKYHNHTTAPLEGGDDTSPRQHIRSKSTLSIMREVELLTTPKLSADDITSLKVLVCLFDQRSLPGSMSLIQMLSSSRKLSSAKQDIADSKADEEALAKDEAARSSPVLSVVALRLMEMTDRTSAIMAQYEEHTTILRDPLLNVFRTFASLNKIPCYPALAIRQPDLFGDEIVSHVRDAEAGLILLPFDAKMEGEGWFEQHQLAKRQLSSVFSTSEAAVAAFIDNGFGGFQDSTLGTHHSGAAWLNSHHDGDSPSVPTATATETLTTLEPGKGPLTKSPSVKINKGTKILVVFFGGADDRTSVALALRFLAQSSVSIEILRVKVGESTTATEDDKLWEGIRTGIEKKRFGKCLWMLISQRKSSAPFSSKPLS
ncbi:hypothetical protein M427DRAFT_165590 [Gonapodya prolifera JEL478]|uniref:Cation/H+ exchanger transmembrane domain-containing protein n=1 Tax=Gonapodya prolifera (strain JEL478) TaxID=1344416 RepID=A0A139AZG0_GONPJ|nr:hypothetical protein M427DRAFT_165590 [Gonapodya prolifera JEL478]|eukprot:KXS22128.1 hypothetical protein M427DRAFT_165590 [Gonapodya prolifera JEL478]